jgi:1-acyl-sn-glycerol-3-phosphate acyltransferase
MEQQRLTWKWRLITALVVVLVRLFRWRIDVRGLDHVPRDSGAVLTFNHHSYVDFVMLAWGPVRCLRRPVRFLAKREIWQSPWSGWVVRWGEAVPVDRGSSASRAGAFDAAEQALRQGDLVAVAPEQTISRSFDLLPLRTGAVRMAQQAGVPIVPSIGWGSQRALTKGRRKRPMWGLPVTVVFGEPLHVGPADDPVEATARLTEVMARMLDEAQRTYPDGTPSGAWWVPARLGGGAPPHTDVLRQEQDRDRAWRSGDDGSPR